MLLLAVCCLAIQASDDDSPGEAPQGPQRRGSCHGLMKPRAGTSDPDRADGRRTGVITKIQPNGSARITLSHKLPGEMADVFIRSFTDYRQVPDLEPPIKGDCVEFTVEDASHNTRQATPKLGRVKAGDIIKVRYLSTEERADHPEYPMSRQAGEDEDDARSLAGRSYTSSKRSSKRPGGQSFKEERDLDWASVRSGHLNGYGAASDVSTQSTNASPATPDAMPQSASGKYVPPHIVRRRQQELDDGVRRVQSAMEAGRHNGRPFSRRHTVSEADYATRWTPQRDPHPAEQAFTGVFNWGVSSDPITNYRRSDSDKLEGRADRDPKWR